MAMAMARRAPELSGFKVGLFSLERWSWTPATSTGSRDSFIGALTGKCGGKALQWSEGD